MKLESDGESSGSEEWDEKQIKALLERYGHDEPTQAPTLPAQAIASLTESDGQMRIPEPSRYMRPRMFSRKYPHTSQTLKDVRIKFQCPFNDCTEGEFCVTNDLYKHIKKTHNTNMICPYCPKHHKSTCMSNFVIHLRGHTGERPWECPIIGCTYTSKSKNSLKAHLNSVHDGMENPEKFVDYLDQDRSHNRRVTRRPAHEIKSPPNLAQPKPPPNPDNKYVFTNGFAKRPRFKHPRPPVTSPAQMLVKYIKSTVQQEVKEQLGFLLRGVRMRKSEILSMAAGVREAFNQADEQMQAPQMQGVKIEIDTPPTHPTP